MRPALMLAWTIGVLSATPGFAQEAAPRPVNPLVDPNWLGGGPSALDPSAKAPEPAAVVPNAQAPEPAVAEPCAPEAPAWQTAWGLAAIRIIPEGPKVAANGGIYHPNFSMDLDLNFWLWRNHGLYFFFDPRLWGQRGEFGVTNGRDGAAGTSKREFDLTGGVAWNYCGPWEARAFGYTWNNLNRGTNSVTPDGFKDGFGVENRLYLSHEYANLGKTGYDVARETFVSIGYYPSKDMVGNDGVPFQPGLFLRAYLTYDLLEWPWYAFADATYISDQSFDAKLLLFDVGVAGRPFQAFRQFEFRLGVENTADFQVNNVQNLWYAAFRYVF